MRKKLAIFITCLLILNSFINYSLAASIKKQNNSKKNEKITEETQKRYDRVNQNLSALRAKDASQAEIDTYLDSEGWERIKTVESISGLSVKGDVNIYSPSFYRDKYDISSLMITAGHKWNRDSLGKPYWYLDRPTSIDGNMGGYDAMGVYLDNTTNVAVTYSSFVTTNVDGTRYSYTYPDSEWAGGSVWSEQDYVSGAGKLYNWDSSSITVYLKATGKYSFYARGQLWHTWNKTTLTNVSIGYPAGISATVGNAGSDWKATGNATLCSGSI